MAYYRTKWYEELPAPWDMDVRGKFCIHESSIDAYKLKDGSLNEREKFFQNLHKEIDATGKFEWLKRNEVNLRTLKVTGNYSAIDDMLHIAVFIDMPTGLRTLYKLTFTETK